MYEKIEFPGKKHKVEEVVDPMVANWLKGGCMWYKRKGLVFMYPEYFSFVEFYTCKIYMVRAIAYLGQCNLFYNLASRGLNLLDISISY